MIKTRSQIVAEAKAHDFGPCRTTGQSLTRWCGAFPHTTQPALWGFCLFLEDPSSKAGDEGLLDGPAVGAGDDPVEKSRGNGAVEGVWI